MKKMLFALLLVISESLFAEEVGAHGAQYVRFTIADPEFDEGVPVFDSLYISDRLGAAYAGHVGILADPCEEEWRCIDIGFFKFAVPSECDQVLSDKSWNYAGLKFRPIGVLDRLERDSKKIRHVIEVIGKRSKREAVAIYSEERGLESFALTEGTGRRKLLIHYYLSSALGALAGGCVSAQ